MLTSSFQFVRMAQNQIQLAYLNGMWWDTLSIIKGKLKCESVFLKIFIFVGFKFVAYSFFCYLDRNLMRNHME